jgi:lysophospholipase L1-like esterase
MKKRSILFLLIVFSILVSCSKESPAIKNTATTGGGKFTLKTNAVAASGAVGDSNIKYFGRWDFSASTQYVSYWGGAYLKVNFSGTTAKIKLGNTSNFYAKIDNGPWVSYLNAGGTLNLTPTALAAGTHALSVAQGKDYNYVFNFQGLVLDAGAVTSAPAVNANLIEYIGDSITAGYTDPQANVSDYAWVCSESLNCEHTQIAYPGINLVSGYTGTGMDAQYLKLQNLSYPSSPNWDFTKYTPKVVVINLGTNDNNNQVPDATFQNTYTSFLATIRTKFANAEIFVLRTFSGTRAALTSAAVNARNAAGDTKVHYINTAGWLSAGDYTDGTHPSVSGHIKVANLLKPILAPYVGGGAVIANGTYKIINRNSALALDAKGKLTANETPIDQWAYAAATNQQWTVSDLGNGQYKIIGVQSGRSLDVAGQSTANGAAIQLYDYTGNDNQKWIITPTSGGYYTIQGVQSGKLIEVVGNTTTPGALVDSYTNNGGNHQQWAFQAP